MSEKRRVIKHTAIACIVLLALLGCSTDDGGGTSVDPVSPEGGAVIVAADDVTGLLAGDTATATINGATCDLWYRASGTDAPGVFAMTRDDSTFLFEKRPVSLPKRMADGDSALSGTWVLFKIEATDAASYMDSADAGITLTLTIGADGELRIMIDDCGIYLLAPQKIIDREELCGVWDMIGGSSYEGGFGRWIIDHYYVYNCGLNYPPCETDSCPEPDTTCDNSWSYTLDERTATMSATGISMQVELDGSQMTIRYGGGEYNVFRRVWL